MYTVQYIQNGHRFEVNQSMPMYNYCTCALGADDLELWPKMLLKIFVWNKLILGGFFHNRKQSFYDQFTFFLYPS